MMARVQAGGRGPSDALASAQKGINAVPYVPPSPSTGIVRAWIYGLGRTLETTIRRRDIPYSRDGHALGNGLLVGQPLPPDSAIPDVSADVRAPADHTYPVAWYTALREHRAPVELVVYRGEGHVLTRPENREDLVARSVAWFRSHAAD